MGFTKKATYYTGTVWEFNLPTGWSCPFAKECLVKVDKDSGKFDVHRGQYRCYAASAERFPGVRKSRWENFEMAKAGSLPELPKKCKAIRVHSSGDFFSQEYFDLWLKFARTHLDVEIWAYTKSLNYWVTRLDEIPSNLTLTASYGGRLDHLIEQHGLKNVKVYSRIEDVPNDRPIDTNDDQARKRGVDFALLDNMKFSKSLSL
jgi:hypothetical protein